MKTLSIMKKVIISIILISLAIPQHAQALRPQAFAKNAHSILKNRGFPTAAETGIKTIFFDIGNVILFVDHHRLSRFLAQHCDIPEEEIYNFFDKDPTEISYQTDKITPEEYFEKLSERFRLRNITHDDFVIAFNDIFEVNQPAVEIMKQLKRAGYRICIISNIDRLHHKHMLTAYSDIFAMTDDFIASYEVGMMKSNPEIFRIALKTAKVEPDEAIFIDDIAKYVEIASSLKITGICYSPDTDLKESLIQVLRQSKERKDSSRCATPERQTVAAIEAAALRPMAQENKNQSPFKILLFIPPRQGSEIDADVTLRIGTNLLKDGKYAAAEGVFTSVIAAFPANEYAWNNLGYVLALQDRYQEAAYAFWRATQLNPRFKLAHLNLGLAFYKLRELEEAKRALNAALRIKPENSDVDSRASACLENISESQSIKAFPQEDKMKDIAGPRQLTFLDIPGYQDPNIGLRTTPADLLVNLDEIGDISTFYKAIQYYQDHPDKFVARLHLTKLALMIIKECFDEFGQRLEQLDELTENKKGLYAQYFAGKAPEGYARLISLAIKKIDRCLDDYPKRSADKAKILNELSYILSGEITHTFHGEYYFADFLKDVSALFNHRELSRPEIADTLSRIYQLYSDGSRFSLHCKALLDSGGRKSNGILRKRFSVLAQIDHVVREFREEALVKATREGFDVSGVRFEQYIDLFLPLPAIGKQDVFVVPHGMRPILVDTIKNAILSMADFKTKKAVGNVSIIVEKEGNFIKITIADTGRGIPKRLMDRIFTPGYSSHKDAITSFTPLPGGLGMGLPKAQREVEFLEGAISVRSRLSKGTSVIILIPAYIKAAEAMPCLPNVNRKVIAAMAASALRPMAAEKDGGEIFAKDVPHRYTMATEQEAQRIFDILEEQEKEHGRYYEAFFEGAQKADCPYRLDMLQPERFFNYFPPLARERVFHKGLLKDEKGTFWILKKNEPGSPEKGEWRSEKNSPQREKLASLLTAGIANFVNIRLITEEEAKGLGYFNGSISGLQDYYLTQVVYDGNVDVNALAQREKKDAYSAIFVAQVFMRKWDAQDSNTCFVRGIPVSIDNDETFRIYPFFTREGTLGFYIEYLLSTILRLANASQDLLLSSSANRKFSRKFDELQDMCEFAMTEDDFARCLDLGNTILSEFGLREGFFNAQGLDVEEIRKAILMFKGIEDIEERVKRAGYDSVTGTIAIALAKESQASLGRDVNNLLLLLTGKNYYLDELDKEFPDTRPQNFNPASAARMFEQSALRPIAEGKMPAPVAVSRSMDEILSSFIPDNFELQAKDGNAFLFIRDGSNEHLRGDRSYIIRLKNSRKKGRLDWEIRLSKNAVVLKHLDLVGMFGLGVEDEILKMLCGIAESLGLNLQLNVIMPVSLIRTFAELTGSDFDRLVKSALSTPAEQSLLYVTTTLNYRPILMLSKVDYYGLLALKAKKGDPVFRMAFEYSAISGNEFIFEITESNFPQIPAGTLQDELNFTVDGAIWIRGIPVAKIIAVDSPAQFTAAPKGISGYKIQLSESELNKIEISKMLAVLMEHRGNLTKVADALALPEEEVFKRIMQLGLGSLILEQPREAGTHASEEGVDAIAASALRPAAWKASGIEKQRVFSENDLGDNEDLDRQVRRAAGALAQESDKPGYLEIKEALAGDGRYLFGLKASYSPEYTKVQLEPIVEFIDSLEKDHPYLQKQFSRVRSSVYEVALNIIDWGQRGVVLISPLFEDSKLRALRVDAMDTAAGILDLEALYEKSRVAHSRGLEDNLGWLYILGKEYVDKGIVRSQFTRWETEDDSTDSERKIMRKGKSNVQFGVRVTLLWNFGAEGSMSDAIMPQELAAAIGQAA